MSAANKLQEFAKMLGAAPRTHAQAASIVTGPSQTNPIATENTTVDGAPAKFGSAMVASAPEADRENEARTANQPILPLSNLDLDTAIRLRWALRDIQAKRTTLTPVSPSDLMILIETGLVEMRDATPMLTNEAHQVLDP